MAAAAPDVLAQKDAKVDRKVTFLFPQASSSSYLGHQEERPAHTEGGFLLQLIHSGPIDSPRDVSLS